jgi:phosphoribosylformylglycinamidine (FGAM) synthase-like enzyme
VGTAHDCSDGGLALALAEACFRKDLGAAVSLEKALAGRPALRADALLFGEDAGRIVISYSGANAAQVAQIAARHGAPLVELGKVGGSRLIIAGAGGTPLIDAPVSALKAPYTQALPRIAGEEMHAAIEGVHG